MSIRPEMIKARSGFSMSDMLVSMAVFGLIAATSIPRILYATGAAQNSAKARDVISTLEQAWYTMKMQDQLCGAGSCTANGDTSGSLELYDQIVGNYNTISIINFVATGTTNGLNPTPPASVEAGVGGCNDAVNNPAKIAFTGWIQFANGIVVSGLSNGGNNPISNFNAANSDYNLLLCIDTAPSLKSHVAGTDIFFANFNPTGNFAGGTIAVPATVNHLTTSPGPYNKNFYYGTSGDLFTEGADGGDANTIPPTAEANSVLVQ